MTGAINLGVASTNYTANPQSTNSAIANLTRVFDGATNNGVLVPVDGNTTYNGFSFTPIPVTSKVEVYVRANDDNTIITVSYTHLTLPTTA